MQYRAVLYIPLIRCGLWIINVMLYSMALRSRGNSRVNRGQIKACPGWRGRGGARLPTNANAALLLAMNSNMPRIKQHFFFSSSTPHMMEFFMFG